MGSFTAYGDRSIDLQIKHQLMTIVKAITDIIGRNVESIILGGGFGRGEGSVKFTEAKCVRPLKDYDLMVIVKRKPDRETINQVYTKVYSALGFSNPENTVFRFKDFVIDLTFTTRERIKSFPDISTYEFKVGSLLLYGEDIRREIPWEAHDIPLSSGWRLLFEKMTGLIGHFPREYLLKGHIDETSKELLIYECYKTYIEIATTLNLLMGCYAPSFSLRSKLFKDNFSKRLPQLYKRLPELPDLVAKATLFKLKPRFEDIKDDPLNLWFNVRDNLMAVSEFYLERYLEFRFVDFARSQKLVADKLGKKYFEPMASAMADNLAGLGNKLVRNILNLALQFYYNFVYFLNIHSNYRQVYSGIFTSPFTAPTIRLHVLAPQVLLSIRQDGRINKSWFESAKDGFRRLYHQQRIESFEDLRVAYLTAYKHLPAH